MSILKRLFASASPAAHAPSQPASQLETGPISGQIEMAARGRASKFIDGKLSGFEEFVFVFGDIFGFEAVRGQNGPVRFVLAEITKLSFDATDHALEDFRGNLDLDVDRGPDEWL